MVILSPERRKEIENLVIPRWRGRLEIDPRQTRGKSAVGDAVRRIEHLDGLNGVDRHGNRETSRHGIHIFGRIHKQHALALGLPVEIQSSFLRLDDARAHGKRLGEFAGFERQGFELLLADGRGRADALRRNLDRFPFDFDFFLDLIQLQTGVLDGSLAGNERHRRGPWFETVNGNFQLVIPRRQTSEFETPFRIRNLLPAK